MKAAEEASDALKNEYEVRLRVYCFSFYRSDATSFLSGLD